MTQQQPRYCIACKHSIFHDMLPSDRGVRQCCALSGHTIGTDASFCGVMRLGTACGPDGKLWEAA